MKRLTVKVTPGNWIEFEVSPPVTAMATTCRYTLPMELTGHEVSHPGFTRQEDEEKFKRELLVKARRGIREFPFCPYSDKNVELQVRRGLGVYYVAYYCPDCASK